jgi:aldose 1-epimerase
MLTLRGARSDSLVVAPEHGAAIVGWTVNRQSLLRRARSEAVTAGNPHAMGCFPLVPYGNRISAGRFRWAAREYTLDRNFGDHPHPIHGIGWQRPWTTEAVTSARVRLSLVHSAQGEQARAWPFPFSAELNYDLEDRGLIITIRVTNRHDAPAPMGIGVHPYLPKAGATALRFKASGVWINSADSLPLRHQAVPPEWDHAAGRPISTRLLDNCFTGWTGPARLEAGPASLEFTASEVFPNLQVFTPPWADFYCVEPVSHVPDAINRPDLPPGQSMQVLEAGETMRGSIRLIRCEGV